MTSFKGKDWVTIAVGRRFIEATTDHSDTLGHTIREAEEFLVPNRTKSSLFFRASKQLITWTTAVMPCVARRSWMRMALRASCVSESMEDVTSVVK